jgi:hypothetical protein
MDLVTRAIFWLMAILGGLWGLTGSWILSILITGALVTLAICGSRQRRDWTRRDFERESRRVERTAERERARRTSPAYVAKVEAECAKMREDVTKELDVALSRKPRS